MTKPIETILKKEVTRKEFLALSGFGVASLLGLGSIIKLLTGRGGSLKQFSGGYGSSPYGGSREADR